MPGGLRVWLLNCIELSRLNEFSTQLKINWQNCSTYDDAVFDDTWDDTLVVGENAVYCASFSEQRTLEQEYAMKALIKIIPGTYKIPGTAGNYEFRLPFCLYVPDYSEVDLPHSIQSGTVRTRESNKDSDFRPVIRMCLEMR